MSSRMVAIDNSGGAKGQEGATGKRNAAFHELAASLTLDIQECRHAPARDAARIRAKIKNDLDRAEALARDLALLPGAGHRQAEIERIRSLKVLYMNDLPRLPSAGVNTDSMDSRGPPTRPLPDSSNGNALGSADTMLRAADDRLLETQRLAAEAEHLGSATMNDLKRQREQLERARRNLYQTDSALDDSNRLMTAITRRY